MSYVNIDIAKLNRFAAAIPSDSEILIEPFKFTSDYDGFYLLFSKLAPLNQNGIIIDLESTEHYSDNLIHFLIGQDFKACVRKTNPNKVDTFIIAKTLMIQAPLRFDLCPRESELYQAQRIRQIPLKTVDTTYPLKIQLTSYANQIFPKLHYFFKSTYIRILSMPSSRWLQHQTRLLCVRPILSNFPQPFQ